MTNNTKKNTREWLLVFGTLMCSVVLMMANGAWAAAHGVPPVEQPAATYVVPPEVYGEYVGSDPTSAAFAGAPVGVTDDGCQAAYAQTLLMPGLDWANTTRRAGVLQVKVSIDPQLAWANWTAIKSLALQYYGVEMVENGTGVPIVYSDPENFTLATMGKSAAPPKAVHPDEYEYGRVDTNQIGFMGKDGVFVKWGSEFRIAIFSSMPHEEATQVVMHEFGHALGLRHIHNHGQFMYGVADGSGGLAFGLNDCQRLSLSHLSVKAVKA